VTRKPPALPSHKLLHTVCVSYLVQTAVALADHPRCALLWTLSPVSLNICAMLTGLCDNPVPTEHSRTSLTKSRSSAYQFPGCLRGKLLQRHLKSCGRRLVPQTFFFSRLDALSRFQALLTLAATRGALLCGRHRFS
jgi:hypothetical protein